MRDDRFGVGDFARRSAAGPEVVRVAEVGVAFGGDLLQLRDDFRIGARDVGRFADVVRQVVELAVGQMQLPRPAADRFEFRSSEEIKRVPRVGGRFAE